MYYKKVSSIASYRPLLTVYALISKGQKNINNFVAASQIVPLEYVPVIVEDRTNFLSHDEIILYMIESSES